VEATGEMSQVRELGLSFKTATGRRVAVQTVTRSPAASSSSSPPLRSHR